MITFIFYWMKQMTDRTLFEKVSLYNNAEYEQLEFRICSICFFQIKRSKYYIQYVVLENYTSFFNLKIYMKKKDVS